MNQPRPTPEPPTIAHATGLTLAGVVLLSGCGAADLARDLRSASRETPVAAARATTSAPAPASSSTAPDDPSPTPASTTDAASTDTPGPEPTSSTDATTQSPTATTSAAPLLLSQDAPPSGVRGRGVTVQDMPYLAGTLRAPWRHRVVDSGGLDSWQMAGRQCVATSNNDALTENGTDADLSRAMVATAMKDLAKQGPVLSNRTGASSTWPSGRGASRATGSCCATPWRAR